MTLPALALPFADPELERDVRAGLDAVEELLLASMKSDYPFVTETSRHLVDAGGKRFRALLALLAAQFADPAAPGVVASAVVVELTHLATLYHDDVMDEASLRRGTVSANSRWGNAIAILTGDFVFAKASDLLADLGPECVRIQARTFERLVHGQIRETIGPEEGVDPLEHYLRVVADKTGSLIGTSCRFGAMLAGAPEPVIETLARFGERIGLAFQLSDDVLDVASEATDSGKMPGTDLREGVASLPVLFALRDPAAAEVLRGDLSGDAALSAALGMLRNHEAMDASRALLASHAEDARSALEALPDGPPRRALEDLCDFVVARTA